MQLVVVREVMSAVRMVTTISTMRFKVFLVVSFIFLGFEVMRFLGYEVLRF